MANIINELISRHNNAASICCSAHSGIKFGVGMQTFTPQDRYFAAIYPLSPPGVGTQALRLLTKYGHSFHYGDLISYAYTANGDAAIRNHCDGRVIVRGAVSFRTTQDGRSILVRFQFLGSNDFY